MKVWKLLVACVVVCALSGAFADGGDVGTGLKRPLTGKPATAEGRTNLVGR